MEEQGQIRSEQPTQRRRDQSREQGRVAYSNELNGGVLLMVGVLAIWLGGNWLARGLSQSMQGLLLHHRTTASLEAARLDLTLLLGRGLELVGFILVLAFAAGVAVSAVQAGGVVFAAEALAFKWEKLSPFEGWQRIVSLAGVVRALFALLKTGVVILLTMWVLWGRGPQIASLASGELARSVGIGWDISIRLLLGVAAALILIGLTDYGFQFWRHERSLMMTRQELREEHRTDEGDPQIRSRRRALARQLVGRRKMLEEVPKATVVITNPTHLAVALRYERGVMNAPQVIAQGAGFIAEQIRERAARHGIPVLERPPLAQALYRAVKVGDEIPVALYYAVSEVLAYVYRVRGEI
ncbi:MAG: EscU/YscU/HrcU family type III secretion system export apparatus switch protein [Planctomycetota bacterium]|nr:EscU/YscU/HrcU family type III secretion system export apparatus switch protein [Planctomycetota bacterium]